MLWQRLKSSDTTCPGDYLWAVKGAFLDTSRDSGAKVGVEPTVCVVVGRCGVVCATSSAVAYFRCAARGFLLLQVRCTVGVLWAPWDFTTWLAGVAKHVFPYTLENWTKRQDTVHQIRVCRSWVEADALGPAG